MIYLWSGCCSHWTPAERRDGGSAIGTAEEDVMNEREKHQNRHKAQLRELEADIDNVKAMARRTKIDAKVMYDEQIGGLEQKLELARKKVTGLRESSGDAWEGLRGGVEHAMVEIRSGIKEARKVVSAN